MLIYYAMGGGLGHLMRASAFLSMNRIGDYRIITASPFATRLFEPSRLFTIPREFEKHTGLLRQYMQDILDHNYPDSFVIDTFSHGILGELNGLNWEKTRLSYITRRLKWERYKDRAVSEIEFKKTYILETPEQEHLEFIKSFSGEIVEYDLLYPEHDIDRNSRLALDSGKEKWFVVHSGPVGEVGRLISYARQSAAGMSADPDLLVISQVNPSVKDTWWCDTCPVHGYFKFASRLITACGFNIMKQASRREIPHDYFPFNRKYDDQFWRAEQAKSKSY